MATVTVNEPGGDPQHHAAAEARRRLRERRLEAFYLLRRRLRLPVSGPVTIAQQEVEVLHKDILNVVGGAPSNGIEVQWTRNGDRGLRGYVANRSLHVAIWTANLNSGTWTDMPSAHTLFAFGFTGMIKRVDLSGFTQARFTVVQAGAAASGARLRLRYATSFTTTIGSYSAIGTSEVDVALSTSGTATALSSSWIDLASGAKADVWLGITGIDGNGTADPIFTTIDAEFR